MNLSRKYYPNSLDEFKINKSLEDIINLQININKLNILFKGNNGCGKTALIDIILKTYYKNENPTKIKNNILKINSLSDLGLNTFRQNIKSFCQTCSTIKNKKKSVIIDDIDTINQQTQQIMRSCIDKYSNKVNFLCSCVNIQKVLDNIQSRMLIIKVNPLNETEIIEYFTNIFKKENIIIDTDDFKDIILLSNRNMNAIYNNIQKLILIDNHITNEMIKHNCTNINFTYFEKYFNLLKENKIEDACKILNTLYENGYSVNDILENLFEFVKYTSLLHDNKKFTVFEILGEYISYFYMINEEKIELYLMTQKMYDNIYG